jgi:hypothetical protein
VACRPPSARPTSPRAPGSATSRPRGTPTSPSQAARYAQPRGKGRRASVCAESASVARARQAKLSLLYDLKAKKDFIKEAKLAGAAKGVGYVLSHAIGKGVTGLTLTSKQKGHTLKAVGDSSDKLTSLSAKGSMSLAGHAIDYEPSFLVKKKATKLKLSAALGAGVSATGVVTATTAGKFSTAGDLSYDASLGEVRRRPTSACCAPRCLRLRGLRLRGRLLRDLRPPAEPTRYEPLEPTRADATQRFSASRRPCHRAAR